MFAAENNYDGTIENELKKMNIAWGENISSSLIKYFI